MSASRRKPFPWRGSERSLLPRAQSWPGPRALAKYKPPFTQRHPDVSTSPRSLHSAGAGTQPPIRDHEGPRGFAHVGRTRPGQRVQHAAAAAGSRTRPPLSSRSEQTPGWWCQQAGGNRGVDLQRRSSPSLAWLWGIPPHEQGVTALGTRSPAWGRGTLRHV